MACDFKVGDEVVCVDATGATELQEAAVYTVSAVRPNGHVLGGIRVIEDVVQLAEIGFHRLPGIWGFRASRFRKVQRRDLTAWLATTNTIEGPVRSPKRVKA